MPANGSDTRPRKRSALRLTCVGAALPVLLALFGCSHPRPYISAADYIQQGQDKVPLVIRPGDKLQVLVKGQDALSATVEVRPGGEIVLPVAGSLDAVNKTPAELAGAITRKLDGVVATPVVTVVVEQQQTLVTVIGEVRTPGRYQLGHREGVLNALALAGGLTQFAEHDYVFVLRRDPQQARIRFDYDELTAGSQELFGFQLRDGDVVVAE